MTTTSWRTERAWASPKPTSPPPTMTMRMWKDTRMLASIASGLWPAESRVDGAADKLSCQRPQQRDREQDRQQVGESHQAVQRVRDVPHGATLASPRTAA